MASHQEWQKAAEDLAGVVVAFLDEFVDMARGSNNKDAALAALGNLYRLQSVDRSGVEPEDQPSRGITRTDATGRDA